MKIKLSNYKKFFTFSLGALIWFSFLLFYNLDTLSIRLWDESRNACNALEMFCNKQYFIRYFLGKPDFWELKPPLLLWCNIVCFNIFGINEFAIRLPSVIAILAMSIAIIFFLKKYGYDWKTGVLTILILSTLSGFMGEHIARTGDHDAMLTAFITIASLLFFDLTQNLSRNKIWFMFFLMLLLGWFTKSIAILFFCPAWLIFLIYDKKIFPFLFKWQLYAGLIGLLSLLASYYIYRNIATPGYWQQVWNNELFNRFLNKSSNLDYHQYGFFYYISNFKNRIGYWLLLTPILIWPNRFAKHKNLEVFLQCCLWITLFLISLGTKNFWYDAILYPTLALLIAIKTTSFCNYIMEYHKLRLGLNVLVVVCFLGSFAQIKNNIFFPKDHIYDGALYNLAYLLRNKQWTNQQYEINILYDNIESPIYFYYQKLKKEGKKITFTNHPQQDNLCHQTYITADTAICAMALKSGYLTTILPNNCYQLKKTN